MAAPITIRDLLVKIGVDSSSADKGLASLQSGMTGLIKTMAGVVAGAGAITAGMFALGNSVASVTDDIDKGARGAALSIKEYQELGFVASQSGLDIDIMSKAMVKQVKAVEELGTGTGRAGERLKKLGLSYSELNKLSPALQFQKVADEIAGMTDQKEQLIAATEIYGDRVAADLMPALQLGGDGIAALSARAHELGMIIEQDGIDAGVKYTDTTQKRYRY